MLVLILGVLLTIEGPWSFGDLWIVLGLVGYAMTRGRTAADVTSDSPHPEAPVPPVIP